MTQFKLSTHFLADAGLHANRNLLSNIQLHTEVSGEVYGTYTSCVNLCRSLETCSDLRAVRGLGGQ